ncbi:hypothetical protein SAMN05660297_02451 [Natronincola peptidivorans]|uniref:Tetratricopeptide repeat-containing protein n=1 Tax=Natronincola peptidivorans TaxID=426128 RepID=A0A1I0EKD2_9FIRM|nr:hypothetical protein [Natronincola peptidivorans]SET45640.1 hypothetical protein SAMN05660297_02451 [Natronincola peptidivorans]
MFDKLKDRAKELYEEGDYKGALEIYEELIQLDQDVFEKSCKYNYMWCLYRVKVNNKNAFLKENIYQTREYIDYILEHLSPKDMLFQITVFKVLKYLKNRPNFDAEKINDWLDKLNPSILSDKAYYYEVEGKQKAKSSNKEEWYALKSKACEKLEIFSECLRVSEEALDIFPQLHHSNNIWFKRRIAISKHKLGMTEEAINILKELLKQKKDWFIYKDISEIYYSLENYEESLDYALEAILKPGEDDKKINLYWNVGMIFYRLNDQSNEEVFKTYSVKLRVDNGWKTSAEEKKYYEEHRDIIDSQLDKELRKRVMMIAEKHKWKNKEKHYGVISKILQDHKAGFITNEKGSYYFRVTNIQGKKKRDLDGKKVKFYLEKAFDKKKNRETENAVNITFVD